MTGLACAIYCDFDVDSDGGWVLLRALAGNMGAWLVLASLVTGKTDAVRSADLLLSSCLSGSSSYNRAVSMSTKSVGSSKYMLA